MRLPYRLPAWFRLDVPARYIVDEMIGCGAYGCVFQAFDTDTRELVAIKKVTNIFTELTDAKRILREVSILARLNCPHIVRLVDICAPRDPESFNDLHLVLEIADSDLKRLLERNISLTELQAKIILLKLLCGVAYLHAHGVVHRDLKPANVLVNQNCGVKICDFGLARYLTVTQERTDSPVSPATEPSQDPHDTPRKRSVRRSLTTHVATRWYRAPEVILLHTRYTEGIDIWSVGCIFAELLHALPGNENSTWISARGSRSAQRALFPGSCCFPLSPHREHRGDFHFHARADQDQLNTIFNIIGTPSSEDADAIARPEARAYLKAFTKRSGVDLYKRFPSASPDAIDLMRRMLAFDPKLRITAAEAIALPYFDDVRYLAEMPGLPPISAPPPDDRDPPMSKRQIKKRLLDEIHKFHRRNNTHVKDNVVHL